MRSNHLYIHAFIVAALLTTACGKKKDSENQGTAATATQTKMPAPDVAGKQSETPIKKPDEDVRLPKKRSADGVREILTAIANRSSSVEQKKKDQEYAKKIKSVSMKIDENKNVTVQVEKLFGDVPKLSKSTALLSSSGEAEFSGNFSGKFRCISADGSCEVAILELKTGSETARVILRKSKALLVDAKFPKRDDRSAEMIAWAKAITKTSVDNSHPTAFYKRTIESFEVINGDSGAKLTLINHEGEIVVMKMSTDQIATKKELSVPVDMSVKLNENSGLKLNLLNSIDAARMKRNDGDGKITVLVTLKENAAGVKERFTLTFKRKSSPVAHDLILN